MKSSLSLSLITRLLDAVHDWRARHRRVDQIALQRSVRNHPGGKRR